MSVDAEKYFLGQCLWSPSIILDAKCSPSDFEMDLHQRLFQAMVELTNEGQIFDERMLSVHTGLPLEVICPFKATNIMFTNWPFYDSQIRRACKIRKFKKVAQEIMDSVGEKPEELSARMQKVIDDTINQVDGFEISTVQETVNASVSRIDERRKNGLKCIGIPSGIQGLDRQCLGFQPRQLYYLGARPSQGKTALMLNCAQNCKEAVGILSAESAKEELTNRMLSSSSKINNQRLVMGIFKEGEMERLTQAASDIYSRGIFIYDEPNMSIDTAVMMARQMKRRFDIKILFVDYLQCLNPSRAVIKQERREQVAYASKQLKQLARTLEIPVVVTAQLRRDAEGNRPKLNDFSDSTQIERDADVAVMIHNIYNEGMLQESWLLVEKNREGRTGDIPVVFNQEYLKFTDK
ncbi:hypothetical protein DYP60_05520 [Sphaerochaeta halotolerans]|uniref:DNA 5'-3' helicase n=2 Tax=Sphaerochaeta halotolerans TaxID=2293840 RepID=A0A372MH20_9SPIR|nr:hypothetical protein DYP60_05520 [Sphaerochaeta halotolerans]